MARPRKRTPETEKRVLDLLRLGNTRITSSRASGISDDTLVRWIKDDPEFAEAVKRAEHEAVARNVAIIQQAAQKSWQAAAWWLERKFPEEWRERKTVDLTQISDDRLLKLIEAGAVEGGDTPGADRS